MSMSTVLPTEGSEQYTAREPHGMSLDEAIHEFIRLDERQAEIRQEKGAVLDVLLPAAIEVRGQSNTARLSASDGTKIKVEFKEAQKTDPDQLNMARDLLGDDQFEKLFKTEYSPRFRELRMFLQTKSTDERIETAKEYIKTGCVSVERSPYVSVEKNGSK